MAKLSAADRNSLPASDFVFQDTRRYPIHDRNHAFAAIKDATGTPDEGAVRAAVCKRWGIGCNLGKSAPNA